MIDTALKFLVDEVNAYINLKSGDPDKVELISVVNELSNDVLITVDKIGCTLISIDEERVAKEQSSYGQPVNGTTPKRNPEIKLNLFILFASNPKITSGFNNYDQGLKLLSYVISFFQANWVFNRQNSPTLDVGIEKLIVDLFPVPMEQQNYLWGVLGAKYLPSVVYKVRLLAIQEEQLRESLPGVGILDSELSNS